MIIKMSNLNLYVHYSSVQKKMEVNVTNLFFCGNF